MPAAASRSDRARKPVRQARQARARHTVEAILTASARILAERGWSGFTTNAVAQRAGVSIGTLYEYFPDKHALLHATMDRHLERGEALVAAHAADAPADPEDLVARLVTAFAALHADEPRLHRVLSSEVPIPPATRARIDALRGRIITLVAAALEGRIEAPHLRATLIVDAADALTHRWYVDADGRPLALEALTAELTRMLSAYLAATRAL